MPDPFAAQVPSMTGPIEAGFSVTPHDTNALAEVTRALWVGAAGNVAVITRGGSTITFVGVQTGTLLPVRATHVKATGTTATNILGLY